MPEYTFRCRKCGHETRYVLPFSATLTPNDCNQIAFKPAIDPSTRTPVRCGGELHRVYNIPNIIYRGSGWYCKDKVLYDVDEDDLYD